MANDARNDGSTTVPEMADVFDGTREVCVGNDLLIESLFIALMIDVAEELRASTPALRGIPAAFTVHLQSDTRRARKAYGDLATDSPDRSKRGFDVGNMANPASLH
jgi:hypothetical protein